MAISFLNIEFVTTKAFLFLWRYTCSDTPFFSQTKYLGGLNSNNMYRSFFKSCNSRVLEVKHYMEMDTNLYCFLPKLCVKVFHNIRSSFSVAFVPHFFLFVFSSLGLCVLGMYTYTLIHSLTHPTLNFSQVYPFRTWKTDFPKLRHIICILSFCIW